ncbi:glucoamylase family protein [Persicitalea sp.]|uniref:glucoamylase family protein n=1 Tax=Persicitalea sp. TaxID=3100273 RepID=UPI0035935054
MKNSPLKLLLAILLAALFVTPGFTQKNKNLATTTFSPADRPRNLSDNDLLELVQKQTFRYFWDFGHPVSGLARERSNTSFNYGHEVVTTGGTGFGVMAMIVAAERQWQPRDSVAARLLKMLMFLQKADAYHGIFPHWMNGTTGKTIPFSRKDDGADLVESAFLFQGLLCARQYFTQDNPTENQLRNRINNLWRQAEWDYFTRDGRNVLYWHWSPNNGWAMDFELRGYNETLITYILAAASPQYGIHPQVYHKGWAVGRNFMNRREYYDVKLPLGQDFGGPLFFTHYSFLGLNPKGLTDNYADYWEQNVNHSLINYKYCVDNPKKYKGYGENSWGLTSSDTPRGYAGHSPTNDLGTITPTAALSSFPYTPDKSMKALRHFYDDLGDKLWSEYGFVDAFNESENWYATSHLAIDQGPIIVMIENHRTGLLWDLFMSCPEVADGLEKLSFKSTAIK